MSWKENRSKILNHEVQQNVLKTEWVKDSELRSAAHPEKRTGQRFWTVEYSGKSWKENRSELKSAAECPEKRTGQRFWTVEYSGMSWKENRSELKSAAECHEKRMGQRFWTAECSRMSWKENGSKILNRRVQQNVLKRERVKDSVPWSAAECPEKRQPMSSWIRSSPAIQWTVHRLLPLTSFRDALKLWNIYKLAGNIPPFTMWTWFGAGMYQNCPQVFATDKPLRCFKIMKYLQTSRQYTSIYYVNLVRSWNVPKLSTGFCREKILIKKRTWHPWWFTLSRGRGKWFGHNLKMVAQINLIHSNSLKGMLAEGMWTTDWPTLYLIIIILYSFMCFFSKMEPLAHYKARNQNTIKTNFHAHRYTHTRTHAHTHTHTHTHTRMHVHTHTQHTKTHRYTPGNYWNSFEGNTGKKEKNWETGVEHLVWA